MQKEIVKYIFIYKNEIIKYKQNIKINNNLSRIDGYNYIHKIGIYGLNLFLRNKNINNDYKLDFIVELKKVPYYMYVERTTLTNDNFIFKLEPIIRIINDSKFEYNNIIITNTLKCNNFIIDEKCKEIKIIDDGINNFTEIQKNILDNLPLNIKNIYLLYNIKIYVNNLPFTTKRVYVYKNTNINLIKLPFNCKLIKI